MKNLSGTVILITGGTGSFGNRVARHLLKQKPAQIRIYSRDEKKQWEMQRIFPQFRYIVGDVRDADRLAEAIQGVNYVFHAAALKQVPACENYPFEAVKTNIIGSQNVCNAAKYNRVKCLVALSTDKAVKPVNAMGISKAMLEKIVCSQNQFGGQTTFCCVRYGNVMGSRGSVIPLFINQILSGIPITVTDLHMTRFMMSIDDALDLVVYAFQHGRPGDIFVQKASAATIETLANALRKLFNKKNELHVIGTRHGEKLYETLLTREEMARAEDLGEYYRIPADVRDLNYASYFTEGQAEVSFQEDYNSHNTHQLNEDGLIELLGKLDFVHDALETGKINL